MAVNKTPNKVLTETDITNREIGIPQNHQAYFFPEHGVTVHSDSRENAELEIKKRFPDTPVDSEIASETGV